MKQCIAKSSNSDEMPCSVDGGSCDGCQFFKRYCRDLPKTDPAKGRACLYDAGDVEHLACLGCLYNIAYPANGSRKTLLRWRTPLIFLAYVGRTPIGKIFLSVIGAMLAIIVIAKITG